MMKDLTLKMLEQVNLTLHCGFSKNASSREKVKPWIFVTFNIIISNFLPENYIEVPQVVLKI